MPSLIIAILIAGTPQVDAAGVADAPGVAAAGDDDIDKRLSDARAALDALSYEQVIDIVRDIPARSDASPEQKRAALFMQAYSLAVSNRAPDADAVFTDLVNRFGPLEGGALPFPVEPQVQIIIDAVNDRYRKRRREEAASARHDKAEHVALRVTPPDGVLVGGRRLFFVARLNDEGIVSVRIDFKREDEREFSSLPFRKRDDGSYVAEIPGSYTRSQHGALFAFTVVASDEEGELARVGSRANPQTLFVSAGTELAADLKASERLPHGTRLGYALVVTPIVSAVFAGAGIGVASLLESTRAQPLAWPAIVLMPPLLGIAGVALSTLQLIDGALQLVPTGIAVGFGAVYVVLVGIVGVAAGALDNRAGAPPLDLEDKASKNGLFQVANAAGLLGIMAATVASTLLVINDAPAAE